MSRIVVLYIALFSLIFALTGAWAQTRKGDEELQAGLQAFKLEQYREAVRSFQAVIANPAAAAYAPDAYFWGAKAYLALGLLPDADRFLEYFLAQYGQHPFAAEARYQKSRLLFLEMDYENAIQASQEFIARHPRSDFVPNAYYWIGESLYKLGQLDEAGRVFEKVLQDYPQSFKVEAARYQLALIEFKQREDELLRLLKWSHEEYLRTVGEFQRREKAYEQAIGAYQRRPTGQAEVQKGGENRQLQELEAENASLRSRLQSLEKQVDAGTAAKVQELADLERTLQVKAEALALKESLLLRYEGTEGKN